MRGLPISWRVKVLKPRKFLAKIPDLFCISTEYMKKERWTESQVLSFPTEHDQFERQGNNLYEAVPITFAQAALGAEIMVQTLDAEEKRRGPMNSKGLAQLAYEKGMYILTAAQSYQAALEASRIGHGYLTYALVEEGLRPLAERRAPGKILVLPGA